MVDPDLLPKVGGVVDPDLLPEVGSGVEVLVGQVCQLPPSHLHLHLVLSLGIFL